MDWSARDTIVGIATPPGKGGVAIVRLSGSRAFELGKKLFQPRNPLPEPVSFESHKLYYGKFIDPKTATPLDHGLIVFMRAPHSYSGEDTVELHLHGGSAVPRSVVQAMINCEARSAEPGEFTFRAFLNQRLTLMQAEAVEELISSQNSLAQRLSLRRLDEGWSSEVEPLIARLTQLLANVEASIDFPDEGLTTSSVDSQLRELQAIGSVLQGWIAAAQWQRLGEQAFTVCLAGAANVGKSTLFNTLLHQERALVDADPGTTRDYLDATLEVEGVPVRLIDTAGLRETTGEVERRGIERSQQWIDRADVLIWVTTPDLPEASRAEVASSKALRVINKIDLVDDKARQRLQQQHPEALLLSAKTQAGVEQLEAWLRGECRERIRQVQQASLCVNDRQRLAIERAYAGLKQAEMLLRSGDSSEELVAQELWGAGQALEELSGKALGPEVIESIFKNFCIGK